MSSDDEPQCYLNRSKALRELYDNLTDSSESELSDIEVEVLEADSSSDEQPLYLNEPEQEMWATDLGLGNPSGGPREPSPRRPSPPRASLGQPVASSTPMRPDSVPSTSTDAQAIVTPSVPVPQPRRVANQVADPQWVRVTADEPMPDLGSRFICRNPGPRDLPVRHEPVEYFKLFLTDGQISVITRETNVYAQEMIEKRRRANSLTPRSRLCVWTPVSPRHAAQHTICGPAPT